MNTSSDVVKVLLGDRSYNIHVGAGLLNEAGTFLRSVIQQQQVAIVSDENVAGLHFRQLAESLSASGIKGELITVPAGEQAKNFKHLESLLNCLLELRVERSDAIIALGGGVIGDLAGFAASILRRGIDVIQIPTTLLAQVDSSVGGKTAINTRHGKNLVGSFHQPKLVLADTDVLGTLPKRDKRAGYAEVVKYGLINQPEFFDWLEKNGLRVLADDPDATRHAVMTCCRSKAKIISTDEREAGSRALLNLGHTFAHALEAEAAYEGRLMHGEAVAIGIVMAFDLSTRMGLCPAEDTERVRRHFAGVGLPVTAALIPGLHGVQPQTLVDHMRQDKKVSGGRLTFILARGIGQTFITADVNEQTVITTLAEYLKVSA